MVADAAANAKSRSNGPELPPLVEPDAARKVGAGARERFVETVDNTGKALVALAGAGVFFFGALVLAVLGWGGVRIARWATREPERASWFRRLLARGFAQEGATLSLAFGALTLLFVPLDWAGVIVTVVLTLLLYYSLRLIAAYLREVAQDERTSFPLWRLLIAAALAAVVLSGTRQREFPEVRPHALVILTDQRRIEGSYVTSDSNSVLIRFRKPGRQPQLLILKRADVEQVLLEKGTYVFPAEKSIFGHLLDLEFSCIPPECRAGDSRVGISSLF